MKHLLTTTLILFTLSMFGQTNCSTYYPFEEGMSLEYQLKNKKGKEEGAMKYTVTTSDNQSATINQEIFDKKGKSLLSNEFDMTCSGNSVTIDFESLLSGDLLQQIESMDTELSGTDVVLPNELEVGQELPDASISMSMNMAGIKMNSNMNITNRKVVDMETITTPAGTFDCVVITQNSSGKMMVNINSSQKTWLAEGVGMVKSEDYNKNGKLQQTTLLTSYSGQ